MNYYRCKFINITEAKAQFENLFILEKLDSMLTIKSAVQKINFLKNRIDADAIGIPFKNEAGYCQLLIASEKSVDCPPEMAYVNIDGEIKKYEAAAAAKKAAQKYDSVTSQHNNLREAYDELGRKIDEDAWTSISIYPLASEDGKYSLVLRKPK